MCMHYITFVAPHRDTQHRSSHSTRFSFGRPSTVHKSISECLRVHIICTYISNKHQAHDRRNILFFFFLILCRSILYFF